MAAFKDKTGHEWVIDLTFSLVEEVKKRHKIDLIDLAGIGRAYVEMAYSNLSLLGQLLYTLCEEQVKAEGMSPTDFGSRMNGPALIASKAAIEEAIADFSPSPELAESKRKLFRAANDVATKHLGEIQESQLREKMYESLRRSYAESSGSLDRPEIQPLDDSQSRQTPDAKTSGTGSPT